MINNTCQLDNNHIYTFLKLAVECSLGYSFFLSTQILHSLHHEIPASQKHIQLLNMHSGPDVHWICTYYDSKNLFIFDSLNSKEIHPEYLHVLQILHPYLFATNNACILFPNVQAQENVSDSGVLAIAFATFVLRGLRAERIIYESCRMRDHLLSMLTNKKIEHFPCVVEAATRHSLLRLTFDKNVILNHECLNADHIDYFHKIMMQSSYYECQTSYYTQKLENIREIPQNKKHIQILFEEP